MEIKVAPPFGYWELPLKSSINVRGLVYLFSFHPLLSVKSACSGAEVFREQPVPVRSLFLSGGPLPARVQDLSLRYVPYLCLFDTNPSLPGTSAYFLHSLILLGSLPKFTPLLTFPLNNQVLDILACSIPILLELSFMLLASGLCILILILILILVYVS